MKKILLVDDQKSIQISLAIGLGREGYLVEVAENAQAALVKLKESHPDFLITDINMPDLNGFVLATIVKDLYPDIKIIFISARDFRDYAGKYSHLDECPRLEKPIVMAELLKILEEKDKEK